MLELSGRSDAFALSEAWPERRGIFRPLEIRQAASDFVGLDWTRWMTHVPCRQLCHLSPKSLALLKGGASLRSG